MATMRWSSTDNALSACLGYDESESFSGDDIVSTDAHRYGWYPGVTSHGTARGEGVAGDSSWTPTDDVGRILAGNGTMRAIRPDRRRYERTLRYAAIRRTERIDEHRGVALLEEYGSTRAVRYYPDRDVGTVATPGTQRDPADDRDDLDGFYWSCDMIADPRIDWHQAHPDICGVSVTVSGRAD